MSQKNVEIVRRLGESAPCLAGRLRGSIVHAGRGKIETRIHLRCRHGSVRHRHRGQRLGRYAADRRLSGHSQRELGRDGLRLSSQRGRRVTSESKRPRVAGGSFRSETRVIAAASSSRRSWRRATLSATSSMRISPRAVSLLSNGAFDHNGTAPIGPMGANRHVHFKGHWDQSISRFVGFTQITGGSCDSGKRYWRMKKVA